MEILKYLDSPKIDILKETIEQLNNLSKSNYRIDELPSMDILNGDKNRNTRILKDVNEFLNSANIEKFQPSENVNKSNRELISERNISNDIEINLEDTKGTIYTLLNIAFKANKYTKWMCERVKELIAENNDELLEIINEIEYIYDNPTLGIDNIINKIKKGKYKEWDKTFKRKIEEKEVTSFIQNLYDDLSPIFCTEDVCYEIKTQMCKQLLISLIQDNCGEFKWGISWDSISKMYVLNVDSDKISVRFAFHIPDLSKVISDQLKGKIEQYDNKWADELRKNTLDTINKEGIDEEIKIEIKNKMIDILKAKGINNDVLLTAKILGKESIREIAEEYPELESKCKLIEELTWVETKYTEKDDEIFSEENRLPEREKQIREKIENILSQENAIIYTQKSSTLDNKASVYALQKHMRDKYGINYIKVVKVPAGTEASLKGIWIDTGDFSGSKGLNPNYKGTKIQINANATQFQESTCAILKRCGIYVPDKIVELADRVVSDEIILDPKHGTYLSLSKKMDREKLFKFAEARREDGTYLIDTTLTDDELKEWGLEKKSQNREREIKKLIPRIWENMYIIKTMKSNPKRPDKQQEDTSKRKYICVVKNYLSTGSIIAYTLGCDYYLSVGNMRNKRKDQVSFSISSNKAKGERLPQEVIGWCESLNEGKNETLQLVDSKGDVIENKALILDSMAVFGGKANEDIFVKIKNGKDKELDVSTVIVEELQSIMGFEKYDKIEKAKKNPNEILKKTRHEGARKILESVIQIIQKRIDVTLDSVDNAGQGLQNLAKGSLVKGK